MNNENIDIHELNKFAKLASTWWDKEGELKTLHQINPLRLQFILGKAPIKQKTTLIDIGCGGGILTEALSKQGAQVTGIDMNASLIEVAKLHQVQSKLNIDYQTTSAEQMAIARPHQYDIVTCLEMLEHVPDPKAIIKACQQLVKPGGHIFFSTLNRTMKAYFFAILGAEYVLNLLPKGTHDYSKFIQPAELHQWAIEAGLIPKTMKGINYHLFSKTFSLVDDLSINYILHAIAN